MDAVQKANAGHPGTAMALAPLAYTLFQRFLRVNPADTAWPDRDRFVLSAGHACVLQYSLLHLVGYDLSLEDLEQFRQWGSRTPGPSRARPHARHRGHDRAARAGLRQRGRHGDGRALPGRALQPPRQAGRRPPRLRDLLRRRHDGGRQPGSRLDRRPLRPRQADRLLRRQPHHDRRHDRDLLRRREPPRAPGGRRLARAAGRGLRGRRRARAPRSRPRARKPSGRRSSRSARTSPTRRPNAVDTAKSHGAPLGEEEVRATKQAMGFDPERSFWVDERVYEHMSLREPERGAQQEWSERFASWREAPAGDGRGLGPRLGGAPARRLARGAAAASPPARSIATRAAGQKAMAAFAEFAPTMIGGAADLVESTKTVFEGAGEFSRVHARAQRAVRHPRARDGRDRQRRRRARRDRQALRLDVPDLLRLHARLGAPVGADGPAGGVGVDARLGRPRRGRPDPPAGRALRGAARDPRTCG